MAQADSVPTPNHAPNPDAHAQQSTTKPRQIRIKPDDRRYFIGGSDARIIMGDDEAASSGSGVRSGARLNRKTYQAISLSNSV
jgi:hypothetical protein